LGDNRLGFDWKWYYNSPANDLVLNTIKESPVLQREGYTQNTFEEGGHPVPRMDEWVVAKQSWQQRKGGYVSPFALPMSTR
jgi:hypothetical protein